MTRVMIKPPGDAFEPDGLGAQVPKMEVFSWLNNLDGPDCMNASHSFFQSSPNGTWAYYKAVNYHFFTFKNPRHATLFKLTWGGS